MPAAKIKSPKERDRARDDFERVTRWRFDALIELGLEPEQAVALIEMPDIAHTARGLAEKGCPPELIAALLKGG